MIRRVVDKMDSTLSRSASSPRSGRSGPSDPRGAHPRPNGHIVVPPPVPSASGRLDVRECFAYCEAFTRAHHENFPVASIFLPAELRPYVFALYAFIRQADDYADEPDFEGRRAEALDEWEDRLLAAAHGKADHPIFVALAETIARFELPVAPLQDLLLAFRMDLTRRTFATQTELAQYVALAAQPIGKILLYVFGVRDADRHRYADDLSAALAYTAFWQDIGRDAARGRIYLPSEDLRHFGITAADLAARRQSRALKTLVRYQCARTRALFQRARPLVDRLDERLNVELALFWYGGVRALDKIEARAGHVFGDRVRLDAADKAWVVSKALVRRGRALLGLG